MIIERPFDDPDPKPVLRAIGRRLHDFTTFAITEDLDIRLRVYGYGQRLALVVQELPGLPFEFQHYHPLARSIIRHFAEAKRSWFSVGLVITVLGAATPSEDCEPIKPLLLEPTKQATDGDSGIISISMTMEKPTRGVAKTLRFINHGSAPLDHLARVTGDTFTPGDRL